DNAPNAFDVVAANGWNAELRKLLDTLTPMESRILRWRFGPPLRFRVLARSARRLSDRHEGRDGRGRSGKGPLP
ncbi:MAG: hypothetical protein ACK5E0_32425, partial [Bradyrhizobium sp.]|uniref:hypothetical protein n=1 Tax=Bradyrhizobium sp. TaxID=376 RepID=UPI00391C7E88